MGIKRYFNVGTVVSVVTGLIKMVYGCFRFLFSVNLMFYFSIIIMIVLAIILSNSIFFNEAKGAVSYLALLASSITMTSLIYNARRHLSEDYTKDAKEYLKRAYEMLEPKQGEDYPPCDRMVWITAARFLKISERLGKKIMMSSHKEIYMEEKQFWRWKTRKIIKNFPSDYYAESAEVMLSYSEKNKEPLSIASLHTVHQFIEWDGNYIDPLQRARFNKNDMDKLLKGQYYNLYHLLSAVYKIIRERH